MGQPSDRRGSKRGARLLVQVAANPTCALMATAAALDLPYPVVESPGEAAASAAGGGSRLAMANGNRFETALWRDGQLVKALQRAGRLPANPVVRDYRRDSRAVERIEREVLGLIRAAALGEPAPDLICHPPLRLTVDADYTLALTPDYLRLVPARPGRPGLYVPGEIKAFHDLGPETDAAALAAAERQVAVYDLALDQARVSLGLAQRDAAGADRADLILRRPHARHFRIAPRPDLPTHHHKDWFRRSALPALARARAAYLATQRELGRAPELVTLPTDFRPVCADICPAHDWCLARAQAAGDLRQLGDAADLLAPAADLGEAAAALATGRTALAVGREAWVARLRPVGRGSGAPAGAVTRC